MRSNGHSNPYDGAETSSGLGCRCGLHRGCHHMTRRLNSRLEVCRTALRKYLLLGVQRGHQYGKMVYLLMGFGIH